MHLIADLMVGISLAIFGILFVAGWITRQYAAVRPR
jgi:hypothetical protein